MKDIGFKKEITTACHFCVMGRPQQTRGCTSAHPHVLSIITSIPQTPHISFGFFTEDFFLTTFLTTFFFAFFFTGMKYTPYDN
jgi:hypothetical protein